jgi:hypothetical protein
MAFYLLCTHIMGLKVKITRFQHAWEKDQFGVI